MRAELEELRFPVEEETGPLLRVQCFGNFEVFTPPGNALPIDFSFLLGYNTQTIASNKRHSNAVLHHRKRS